MTACLVLCSEGDTGAGFLLSLIRGELRLFFHCVVHCRRRCPSRPLHNSAFSLPPFHGFVEVRMKKFFPVFSRDKSTSSVNLEASETQHPSESIKVVDYELLETDPGIRPPISSYHPDIQNENVSKYGGDHFVTEGFSDWKNSQRLANHATSSNSHVDCVHMSYALMNPNQSIKAAFVNQAKQMNSEYRVRVNTSLIATKFLLRCGMPFRGSDESFNSLFKGSFLELVDTLKEINLEIANVIDCTPGNNFMTAPTIQKDLVVACACEITQQIVCDIADDVFCVLIDESGDVAGKEQMVVVIRYVNSEGFVKERFLGIVSVKETSAKSLKEALEKLLSINGLSLSSIRGQGYDGASNIRGKFGGLRTLIQNENPSAYYVHCFAHQLQLALVACAKTHKDVSGFFGKVNMLVNFIRSSNKRQELLRDKQVSQFAKLIEEGQIETGFTNDLNIALQKCDQDLLNALSLVKATKEELQEMRNNGWEKLISKFMEICNKHDIDMPDLDAPVLDLQLHELNARFDEENTERLQCVSCLSPSSSFEDFDVKKLLRKVELYPNDFVDVPEVVVRHQLQNYVKNVRCDPKFAKLNGLSDLCAKLVETKKCNTFDIVYRLLKLALILPVATASVERVFLTIKFVKSQLCNKMGDQ
ncbi:Zinc finger MYM-type protein 1 [Glycine soja]|uniref:Zinc finger MYM-type protein 1 n=1 Tax=Glycine soja TaxID=3848 RepID=A0A445L6V7_GLYSO|nr:Zinc finger MYM-type protein 1 [Glycine soja]